MIVSPSILSADFTRLGEEIGMLERAGADWIHCDVMDGIFVPNISFGFPVIKSVSKITSIPLDVHLMIMDPGRYVGAVRDAGAAIMNVHYEACTHLHRTVQAIHDAGMKAGVTLNPATPVMLLQDIIGDVDMVLLMSVNPGFSGQKFIEHTLVKARELRKLIDASGSKAIIQMDGGVSPANIANVAAAGVDSVVAGNAVFKAENPEQIIKTLQNPDAI